MIQAIVEVVYPAESGTAKSGKVWRKQQILLSAKFNDFHKKFYAALWNDNITNDYKKGDTVKVDLSFESKEFNGKWYSSITIEKLEKVADAPEKEIAPVSDFPPNLPEGFDEEKAVDDSDEKLPF